MSNYDFYLIEKKPPVAWIFMNTPEKKNALNMPAWKELPQVLEEIENDSKIKTAIIAGKGSAFSSGIDLKMVQNLPEIKDAMQHGVRLKLFQKICMLQESITSIERCKKPVIAAIHGYCTGAGLDMAAACDFRFCSKDAIFSIKETAVGFVPDIGVLQRIAHITGQGIARELAFTSRFFDAVYAKEIFLINKVLDDPDSLFIYAEKVAKEIAANPPLAVEATKDVMNFGTGESVRSGLTYVASVCANIVPSQDLYEAISAFIEKREPRFSGK